MADNAPHTAAYEFHLSKDPGRARTSGAEFEYKLAALVYLRAKSKPEVRFQLASNVKDANPIDDLFLRLRWVEDTKPRTLTYYIQLKHSEARKPVKIGTLLAQGGDFSIKKYFECYKRFLALIDKENRTESENFLFNYKSDNIRFVIYTNRPVEHHADEYNEVDYSYADLFVTSGVGRVFNFNKNDEAIWNLYERTPDNDIYRKQFLPRLLICSDQTNASDMDYLIKEQLNTTLKGKTSRKDHLSDLLVTRFHNWWDGDEVSCLSDNSLETEYAITKDIKITMTEDIASCPLNFTLSAREEMRQRISCTTDICHIVSPGVSEILRCAKFQQCFEPVYKSDHLMLYSKVLINYPIQLLETACLLSECIILVADIISPDIETFLLRFPDKRLIVMTSAFEETWQNFFECMFRPCKRWEDTWSFHHLEKETQMRLIQDSNVVFQGHNIGMRDIEAIWPSLTKHIPRDMINAFADKSSELVQFGDELPPLTTLYQRRSLQHPTIIKLEALEELLETEHLVLSGFTMQDFPQLFSSSQRRNITFVNEESDKHHVLKTTRKNTHFLSQINREIIWEKTEGCKDKLVKYIEKKNEFCANLPICSHSQDVDSLVNWKDRIILITGDPGIGKTTFLTRLANTLKQRHPAQWIVFMSLKSMESTLQEFNSVDMSTNDIIDMMSEAVGITGSSCECIMKEFLKFSVVTAGNATVLVDAVDEVCPNHKETVIRMVKAIAETKVSQIWITARANLYYDLGREFSSLPLTFHPFTREDQIKYLRACQEKSGTEFDDAELRGVIESLDGIQDQTGRSVLDVPLHVVMIAEIYEECKHIFIDRGKRKMRQISLPQLYRMFVDKKLRVFQRKHAINEEALVNTTILKQLQRHFSNMHTNCAMLYLFEEQVGLDLTKCRKFLEEEKEDLEKEKTGIITDFVNGKPVFSHRSFAEYFAAQWLAQNYNSCTDFCKRDLFYDGFVTIRIFFDSFLSRDFPLHEAVLEDSVETVKRLLEEGQDVNQKDAGGRLALHLAANYGYEDVVEQLLEGRSDTSLKDSVLEWTPLRYADNAWELGIAKQLIHRGACRSDIPLLCNVMIHCSVHKTRSMIQYTRKIGETHFKNFLVNLGLDTKRWIFRKSRSQFGPEGYIAVYERSKEDEFEILKNMLGVNLDEMQRHALPLFYALSDGQTRMIVVALPCGKHRWRPREGPAEIFIRSAERIADFLPTTNVWEISLPLSDGWRKNILLLATLTFPYEEEVDTSFAALLLVLIAGTNDYVSMKGLIECGMEINVKDSLQITPLHWAASNARDNTRMVYLLLEHGADCNAADYLNRTSCHWLFGAGDFERKRWCRYVENESYFFTKFKEEQIMLFSSVLRADGNFNVRDKYGRLPLHYAAARDELSTCCFLMCASAVNVTSEEPIDSQTETILNSETRCRVDCWDVQDIYYCTPLYYAVVFDRVENVRLFLEKGANASWREGLQKDPYWEDIRRPSLLHVACQAGSHRVVKELVDMWNFHVDEKDENGLTPLHYLCFTFDILVDCTEILKTEMGKAEQWRITGKEHIFHYLRGRGVDTHAVNIFLRTPLHYASWYGTDYLLKPLTEAGVPLDAKDVTGKTALNTAAEKGNTPTTNILLRLGADYKIKDSRGRTPLFNAARQGFYDIVEDLWEVGADINAASTASTTPLISASWNGQYAIVDFLLKKGADYKRTNERGQSALHVAALRGEVKVLKYLLERGIDVNMRDNEGFTAIHYAQSDNAKVVIAHLLQHGAKRPSTVRRMPRARGASVEEGVTAIVTDSQEKFPHLPIFEDANANKSEGCKICSIF